MRRYAIGALLALILPGAQAAAQGPIGADTPVRLNQEDAARYYPDRARRMGVSSWARLRCVATDKGVLADCVVVGEGRPDFVFGLTLIKIARLMRIPADQRERLAGKPVYVFHVFQHPEGLSDPDPVQPPSPATIEAARPRDAAPIGMTTLTCFAPLTPSGGLYDCTVEAESPAGQGYGAAAIALAGAYRATLPTPETVEVSVSTHGRSEKSPSGWMAWIDGRLVKTSDIGAGAKDLPPASMTFDCRWTPDGRLRECRPDRMRMRLQPVSHKGAKAVKALLPEIRLTRTVMFNVNWGQ